MLNYNTHTDQELSALLKNDDHAAFNEIYSRYWKKMLMIAWNHSQDKVSSKDIVHEVFISLWERRREVLIDNLPAFLATAVKFSIYKYYQRESRRSELLRMNYEFSDLTQDEEKLDALFLQEYINGIVEEMPAKCRLVFRYREQGMKNKEIAEEIKITQKAVERNLTRALNIIRGELKNYGWLLVAAAIQALYAVFKSDGQSGSSFF
jgi:RNA polymerase sigma-70 factor (ECF subfamily)